VLENDGFEEYVKVDIDDEFEEVEDEFEENNDSVPPCWSLNR
jgi:hypothetical protein